MTFFIESSDTYETLNNPIWESILSSLYDCYNSPECGGMGVGGGGSYSKQSIPALRCGCGPLGRRIVNSEPLPGTRGPHRRALRLEDPTVIGGTGL